MLAASTFHKSINFRLPWSNIKSIHSIIKSIGLVTKPYAESCIQSLGAYLPPAVAASLTMLLENDEAYDQKKQCLDDAYSALPLCLSPHVREALASALNSVDSFLKHDQPDLIQFLDLLTCCGEDNVAHGVLPEFAAFPAAAWKGATKLCVEVFSTERCPLKDRQAMPHNMHRQKSYCGICDVSFNRRFKFKLEGIIPNP